MTAKLAIAPMLDVTDRHFRMFMRLLSARAMLYTEMKTCGAVLHGDRARVLGFDMRESPLALQLGGSDARELSECARIAEQHGYDEINLNVGCPSARVQSGRFGACLMTAPALVAKCVAAMRAAVMIPVTVKTRIGVDEHDSYAHLAKFIARVAAGGCEHFIIHARKAWLDGLSPKQNRNIPPLNYERVYRLKKDFPNLRFSINGGVKNSADARKHLSIVDGVMIGREARRDPWMLRRVDREIFGGVGESEKVFGGGGENLREKFATRAEVARAHVAYIEQQLARGVKLRRLISPMLGLYHGVARARMWRRCLSEGANQSDAGVEVLLSALEAVESLNTTPSVKPPPAPSLTKSPSPSPAKPTPPSLTNSSAPLPVKPSPPSLTKPSAPLPVKPPPAPSLTKSSAPLPVKPSPPPPPSHSTAAMQGAAK